MRREATNGEKRKWTHRVAEGKTSVNDEKLLARRRWLETCVKKCPALSLKPFQGGRSAGHQAQGPRPSRRRAGPSPASRGQRRPAPPPLAPVKVSSGGPRCSSFLESTALRVACGSRLCLVVVEAAWLLDERHLGNSLEGLPSEPGLLPDPVSCAGGETGAGGSQLDERQGGHPLKGFQAGPNMQITPHPKVLLAVGTF